MGGPLWMRLTVAGLVLLLTSPSSNAQSSSGLATPAMGWSSWNHFNKHISDAIVRAQADAMVASGMRDAGYVYVNIDDGWQGRRDRDGYIQSNRMFPDMRALADYVHGKGLKLGLYSSPGRRTCAGFEGSYGHEKEDAETYADWGIDYLKYDLCGLKLEMQKAESPEAAHKIMVDAYGKMRDALQSSGRDIAYAICQYGRDEVWKWGASVGAASWRTSGDIRDKYARMAKIGFAQAGLARYAGPGHWNDPDMLEVGNGGMSRDEYRTHVSLWAILAAPLVAGNDLTQMDAETVSLLTNRDVVAIDQDAAGRQGDRVSVKGTSEVWARPLADGSKAVGLFNRNASRKTVSVDLGELGFPAGAHVRDVWSNEDLGVAQGSYETRVPGHGVVLLRVGALQAR